MTDLPQGWREVALKDLAESGAFFDGDWVESEDQDPNGDVRLVQLADVGEGVYRFRSDRWLRTDQAAGIGVSYLEQGDLLIARMPDPMGRCCQVPSLPTKSITAVDVAVLRLRRSDANTDFVMWQINSPETRASIAALASGTTRQRVSRKNLGGVAMLLPPLAEQERIVEILEEQFSRLDSALASVKAVREKAKEFRRSLLHSAFSGELTGGTQGWREVALGEVADVGWGDLSITKKSYVQEGYTAFSATGPDGKLPYFDYDQTGIVVSAIGAQCGKVFLATGRWSCIKNTMRILPSSDDASIKYLFQLLNTDFLPKRGSGQPFIGQKDAREALVALPPLAEQERIVEILEEQFSRLDKALEVANQLEARIASERRSLLHSAFTGALTATWRQNND